MRHYFDWAATALPLDLPSPSGSVPFGNPSSRHLEGRQARETLEAARSRCAAVLGVPPKQLYFSSGGTESNAIPLQSLLLRKNAAALVSSVEHPSVRENALVLKRLGATIMPIGVEKDGRVTESTLEAALAKIPTLRFAAIMGVNNETGAVMDLGALVKYIRQSSRQGPPVHVHSDLVQALGKIPLDISGWDLDSAAFSAHKIGGPRGVGLLWLRGTKGPQPLEVLGVGGGQEGGIRPGTENTAGALALAECMEAFATREAVEAGYAAATKRWKPLIQALRSMDRCTLIPEDRSDEDPRFSPWILQAGFRGIPGEVMARALDDAGFAVSTGSACSSREQKRPVLEAMGIGRDQSLEGVRFSQGWSTTIEEIEMLTRAIQKILEAL
ncbi:cysteine desulfurase [Treponema primitia ZAS-2]|uniref:Cysteine desulfurase n=1 Tax=Treponema primitia (strain ATCC BAA-887 / DSM 12427 / ZAS-2) TaxID=545694 RepID=F5YPZ4_TREPZ|nr:aminotransferase class V-fold PLP-dependent enzyme [Treponema primitia]AEF85229.1 cysteine desulfurase [Treponema primitia ZAS-2]